jgi:hypothetical protein
MGTVSAVGNLGALSTHRDSLEHVLPKALSAVPSASFREMLLIRPFSSTTVVFGQSSVVYDLDETVAPELRMIGTSSNADDFQTKPVRSRCDVAFDSCRTRLAAESRGIASSDSARRPPQLVPGISSTPRTCSPFRLSGPLDAQHLRISRRGAL